MIPTDENDLPKKVVAVSVDVTEIKELQNQLMVQNRQLRDMDNIRNQFINTAAHELRTPVTVIQGFLEIINQDHADRIPQDITNMLEAVGRNTERLTSLTNALLDLQRLETGRLSLKQKSGNINDLIIDACSELESYFREQGLEYKHSLDELGDSRFDSDRINQVIVNLLMNAIKFTPDTGVIEVSSWKDDESVYVKVSDKGIGVTEKEKDSLFKPFPGIQHGLNVPSTGLGLSITKGIVELHGGKIGAESEGKGKGSAFTFSLPR